MHHLESLAGVLYCGLNAHRQYIYGEGGSERAPLLSDTQKGGGGGVIWIQFLTGNVSLLHSRLVNVGDVVSLGDSVCEVQSDKVP